jgi:type IX secretion system PorP/SprF family membrane protein
MKTKIRICSLLVLVSTGVFAQQFSNHDPYLSNPSLGGYEEMVKIGGLYQTTMTVYDYHPTSFILWGSSPFNNQRVAGGFKIASQEGGVIQNLSAEATFIYHVPVGGSKLSFGLSGGFNQLQLMRDRVHVHNIDDPILQGSEAGNWFNANFGLAFSKVNNYYFGLAAYNLLPKQTNWMVSSFENRAKITYILSGMYSFALLDGDIIWEFSGNAYTNNPTDINWIHYNVDTKLLFWKDFWVGTGYSDNITIKGQAGFNVQNLSFGYIGFYSFGNAGNYGYSFPKHEIILMLKLPYSKPSK